MKQYSLLQLNTLPSRYRANLINSCTGYKSLNLIGTIGQNGTHNVAIFNSVIHLGSSPALIGFTLRPLTVQRDTYNNIKASGKFTVNQVHETIIAKAHQTAAKYPSDISEFEAVGLETEIIANTQAPFVKESIIRFSCTYVNEYEIKENGCIMIIGALQTLYLPEALIAADGWIDLTAATATAGIGLDGYAVPRNVKRYSYAKPEIPTSILK